MAPHTISTRGDALGTGLIVKTWGFGCLYSFYALSHSAFLALCVGFMYTCFDPQVTMGIVGANFGLTAEPTGLGLPGLPVTEKNKGKTTRNVASFMVASRDGSALALRQSLFFTALDEGEKCGPRSVKYT